MNSTRIVNACSSFITRYRTSRLRPVSGLPLVILLAACAGCATPAHGGARQMSVAGAPPDVVHELWEQHWTLATDGSIVYHEKHHIRLNSDRVFRAFGNPRITYNTETDEVEVLQARTRLPSGEYVELPDYSTVEVSPDAAAGWPAFANIRQITMVMSGIEPGCVLELEHRVTTKPGTRPYLTADLRIDDRYPVRSRTVSVSLPPGVELSPVFSGLPEERYTYAFEQSSDGYSRHRWEFVELPGQPVEPQDPPWRAAGVRLAFSTAPDAKTWVRQELEGIAAAADESELLSRLAKQWAGEQTTAGDKLAAIQQELAGSFNFVNFDAGWQPAHPRKASDVIAGNYGLPREAAAVLLALARAAGVAVEPALLVADEVWNDAAAQRAMVAAYVVVCDDAAGGDGLEIWHPRHGRVFRDRRWAGHTLLTCQSDELRRVPLPAWLDPDESRVVVVGSVEVDKEGKLAGKLSVQTSGLFVSPSDLETSDEQKRRARQIIGHVLPGVKLKALDVRTLAPGRFDFEARIESGKALPRVDECYELKLPEDSPALADVPLPVTYSRRQRPARLLGPFDEQIELKITWPAEWHCDARPAGIDRAEGAWGLIEQTVRPMERGLVLRRQTRVNRRELTPAEVLALRGPVNQLRAEHARTLLLRP